LSGSGSGAMANDLVPELAVTDWRRSRCFYCDLLGFAVIYERPEEGFSYLRLGAADLMIDEIGKGRTFDAGEGLWRAPLGRGMNLQIRVAPIAPLLAALAGAGRSIYLPVEERWYRTGAGEVGNRQFIIADPDGYLLRFHEHLGYRPA